MPSPQINVYMYIYERRKEWRCCIDLETGGGSRDKAAEDIEKNVS
jgi:hypothetical protein